jgi:hypothetical protein
MQAKKRKVKAATQAGKIDPTRIRRVVRALHVVPKSGRWVVTASGGGQPTQEFSRKEDAVHFGESVARRKRTTLIVHGSDGRIQEMGNPPRDRNH